MFGGAEGAVQGEQSTVCHPEHVACPGLLQERSEVLILGAEAVIAADRPAETTAAAAGNVDGEHFRESAARSHQMLGGVDAAVQQDNPWPATQLSVTDPGAVG